MSFFSKETRHQRIHFTIDKNRKSFYFNINVDFHEIKILQLQYHSTDADNTTILRIRTGLFDQTFDANIQQPFFIVIPKPMNVQDVSMYNKPISADQEFITNNIRTLNQIMFEIYEDNPSTTNPLTLVSDAHLSTNPLYLELILISKENI